MTALPIIHLDRVYHVGTMDPARKKPDSYEGAGLSVSLHPSAWRRIARTLDGPCWALDQAGGAFLDAHALGRRRRAAILAWAVANGLATACDLWRIRFFDEELDSTISQFFPDEATARDEAEFFEAKVRRVKGHMSTPALDQATLQTSPSLSSESVLELVLPLWVEQHTALDGVWWADRFDPCALSAPRGVIHPARLTYWTARQIDHDPDDEDGPDTDEDEDDDDA